MGGVWGLASSTALENLPVELRGLASGIVQQGYAVGYLFAAVVNLTIVPHNPYKWRAMFWNSSSLFFLAAILRALLPESVVFLRAKATENGKNANSSKKTQIFFRELKEMLKRHWPLCIYAVLFMAGALFGKGPSVCGVSSCPNIYFFVVGFSFLSHGSQVRTFMKS